MTVATCTQCNKPLRSGVDFCPHCGAPVKPGKVVSVAKKPQKPSRSKTKSARSQQQSPAKVVSKKQVNRRALIIKAVANSLLKSLALSAAVLGPGMMFLMSGEPGIGMIWLFAGSFAMMAWTYRKPWRLSWLSCFAPAAGSALCYIVQIAIFGVPPLDMLLIVCVLGLGIGYWRAAAHRVYTEGQAIMAQRTLVYLLIWAAAYAATQVFGFVGQTYLATGGLLTGAFTTSMLIAVSVMIFMRFREVRASLAIVLIAGFFLTPVPATASDFYWELKEIRLKNEWRQDTPQLVELTNTSLVLQDKAQRLSFSWTLPDRKVVRPGETVSFTLYCRHDRFDASARITSNNWLKARMFGFERPAESKNYYVGWVDPTIPSTAMRQHSNLKFVRTMQVKMTAPQKPVGSLFLQLWLHEQDIGFPIAGEPVSFVFEQIGGPDPAADSGTRDTENSRKDRGGIRTPPEPLWQDLEKLKDLVLTVTMILIGLGISINVAQAIAAALANALQAGAEFTSEEIQRDITDALFDNRPNRKRPQDADQIKSSKPPPDIDIPGGQVFDTNDDGQYLAPDENGDWQWMSEQEAKTAAEALWQEEAEKDAQRAEHTRKTEKIREQWRSDTQERYAGERAEQARERAEREAALDQYERVERAATRVGDLDILMRTGEERVFKQDGSIDTDYLDRVRKALRARIGRDVVMPDAKLADNSLNRIFKETFDDSMDDATNSLVVRVVAGMASGGTSEVAFQGREMWNAVKKAAEDAEDKGREMSAWDSATVVTTKIAKDNLPLNTLDALKRMRKGEDISLAELGMSAIADLFSAAELTQTIGVNTGELLENFGRRVLSEDAMRNAANIHSQALAGAESVYRKAQNVADRANQAFDAALERLGLKKPSGRLTPAQAAARFENGRLTSGTNEIIESVQSNPPRGVLEADDAFQAGRASGRQRIEDLSNAVDELEAARKLGKANPAEISALEGKVRAEVVRIQADKHAMNEMNRLPKNADGNNPLIKTFNGEMQKIHSQADRKMIERLAKEYGVRPEDIQPVTITNMAGEAGVKVDPAAPPRDHYGQASSWEGNGAVERSRAAKSAPGTVDGLETGRLPDTPAGEAKGNKVSFDRDLTMRVRTIENGRVVYRDIPSSTTARIYNEEFFEAATGRTLSSKRGPEVAGLSAEAANQLGHSIDFKDTHLTADAHLADVMALDDPDLFAKRMDQATTDRLHPEAYGTGQADLDTATKDSFRGRDLTDAQGTAKTVEFKVHHWLNEADSLREMAAATSDPATRSRLLEQAVAHQEEAQRQLIKQYGNMAIKRTDAMQLLDNARGASIPQDLSERINVLKRTQVPLSEGGLTPAKAEAVLNRMGSSTKQVAGQLSAYVEGLQKLRNPSVPKTSGPTIVFQGWQDDFKTEQSA